MKKFSYPSKSVLLLFSILGILIISTLVVISNYFLRPTIEASLKESILRNLSKADSITPVIDVSGRDISLYGIAPSQNEANLVEKLTKETWGVRQVRNNISVKK